MVLGSSPPVPESLTSTPLSYVCAGLQLTGSLRASFFYILGVMLVPALVLWWKVDYAQGLVDAGRVPDSPDRVEKADEGLPAVSQVQEGLPAVSRYASCTSDEDHAMP